MTLTPGLTRPEDAAEKPQRRRLLRMLMERGGCWACLNRDREVELFGRSVCKANPKRAFPLCTSDGRAPAFEMDEKQVREAR